VPVIDRRNGRISQKEALLQTLTAVYPKSKSIDSFLAALRSLNYEPYYRSGRLTGVRSESGLKFRFNRLGYDHDAITKLDAIRVREEKELAELRDIRARQHSLEREEDDDRVSRMYERDEEEKDQGRQYEADRENDAEEQGSGEEEDDDQDDMR